MVLVHSSGTAEKPECGTTAHCARYGHIFTGTGLATAASAPGWPRARLRRDWAAAAAHVSADSFGCWCVQRTRVCCDGSALQVTLAPNRRPLRHPSPPHTLRSSLLPRYADSRRALTARARARARTADRLALQRRFSGAALRGRGRPCAAQPHSAWHPIRCAPAGTAAADCVRPSDRRARPHATAQRRTVRRRSTVPCGTAHRRAIRRWAGSAATAPPRRRRSTRCSDR